MSRRISIFYCKRWIEAGIVAKIYCRRPKGSSTLFK
jgi:hypothetical protein